MNYLVCFNYTNILAEQHLNMHEASSTAPVVKPAWVFDLGYLAARTARAREEADGDVGNPMPAGT